MNIVLQKYKSVECLKCLFFKYLFLILGKTFSRYRLFEQGEKHLNR